MKYLPHAQTALELPKHLAGNDSEADLFDRVAESNSVLGRHQIAEEMYRQLVTLREKVFGKVPERHHAGPYGQLYKC
ncbi:hypothetical protein GGI35DRAFT_459504 [Trichoderma velutinum]